MGLEPLTVLVPMLIHSFNNVTTMAFVEAVPAWPANELVSVQSCVPGGAWLVFLLCHGQGVGKALVLEAAKHRGSLDVDVYEANQEARAFYRRVGFIETSRRELDDHGIPMPLIKMRLD